MRKILLCPLAAATAMLTVPSVSQETPPPTVDDYVCTFSGDCGDQNQTDDQQENSQNPTGEHGRLVATRGFALSGTDSPRSNDARRPAPPRRPGPAPVHRRPQNIAERTPSSSAVPAAGPGQRVNLRLNFVTGSATLTPAARAQAEVFARSLLMPQLRNMRFLIEGHTDSVGARDRNLALSQRRAQSLADFLVAAGVARDRLEVRGYGPDRPLPNLPGTAGENRRVEAVRIS
jgi:outer membrane protein OmpA-like peptidoglycan-associated protein